MHAITQTHGYHYLVSRPEDGSTRPANGGPLILFLHGAGERGAQIDAIRKHGLARLLTPGAELSAAERAIARDLSARFVVVAPQCPLHEVWDEARLLALLDDIETRRDVDRDRVYLTGLSMGGFGTWTLGLRHPERFAALVPICGGGRIADVKRAAETQPAALKRVGVWAFHGARDGVVPLEESTRMIDALKRAGRPDAKLTVYPEYGHDSWTESYANAGLYDWLLRHAR